MGTSVRNQIRTHLAAHHRGRRDEKEGARRRPARLQRRHRALDDAHERAAQGLAVPDRDELRREEQRGGDDLFGSFVPRPKASVSQGWS